MIKFPRIGTVAPSQPMVIQDIAQIYRDRGFLDDDDQPTKAWFDTAGEASAHNVYMRLDGTIAPHKFDHPGLWRFDGQFYYLPKGNPNA